MPRNRCVTRDFVGLERYDCLTTKAVPAGASTPDSGPITPACLNQEGMTDESS